MSNEEDEGKTKYAVVLDDQEKQAQEGSAPRRCPTCHSELDDAGACPVHGTEPFEPH